MTNKPSLSPDQGAIVAAILKEHLPPHAKIWVFGSRATGKNRPYSDLDLAVELSGPLSLSLRAILADAFHDSALPFTVDILDMKTVKDPLKSHIYAQGIAFFPKEDIKGATR